MAAFLRHPTLKRLLENTNPPPDVRRVSREELQKHNGEDGCAGWVSICGMVYDLDPFFDGRSKHPGGPRVLRKHLGKDITGLFMQFHYPRGRAVRMAPGMLVGVLEEEENEGIEEDEEEED